jgi:hypothetical protein
MQLLSGCALLGSLLLLYPATASFFVLRQGAGFLFPCGKPFDSSSIIIAKQHLAGG